MQANGFRIKQEIKLLELSKEALESELESTYAKMPDDTVTRTPKTVALFQTAQAYYNQHIEVECEGRTVPLAFVIKLEGVINRIAKVWRETSKRGATATYGGLDRTQIYPVSQVNAKGCFEETKTLAKVAAQLQGIIGTANAREIKVNILDVSWPA